MLLAKKADWGGIKWIEFNADGSLKTPWGTGRWGDASTAKKPNTVFAEFIGQVRRMTGWRPPTPLRLPACPPSHPL